MDSDSNKLDISILGESWTVRSSQITFSILRTIDVILRTATNVTVAKETVIRS